MLYGLSVRRAAERQLACPEPVFNGAVIKASLGKVARHNFGLARDGVFKPFRQCMPNLTVQLLAMDLKQAFIGCRLHQRVLKAVYGFCRLAMAEHQLCQLKFRERTRQCRLVATNHLTE